MPSRPGRVTTARSIARSRRLDEIEDMILDGKDGADVVREIRAHPEKWPGEDGKPLDKRQVHRDVQEVWHRLQRAHEADRGHLRTVARVKWERRERLADRAKDLTSGNVALANWTRLLGLYAPTRAELEVKGAVQVNVNVQVRALVNVLSERGLGAGGRGDEDEPSDDDEPASVPSSGSVN